MDKVKVLLFAAARQTMGSHFVEIELPPEANVGLLKLRLMAAYPQMKSLIVSSRIAVDQAFADDKQPLTGCEELALIPPVSGG